MRNFKNTMIDNEYLQFISTKKIKGFNENNNVIFHNVNIKELTKENPLTDLSITEKNKYFISINPQNDISCNELKNLLHLAYSRFLRYELGKKYRQKEPPYKMDIVIEEKDNKIHHNHIHILVKSEVYLWDLICFIGILFYFMKEKISTINFMTENVYDEVGNLGYMLKRPNTILMNETDI